MGLKSKSSWRMEFCIRAHQCSNHNKKCGNCVKYDNFKKKRGEK